ncbi:MAG: hypothetical protein ACON4K_06285 [Akkermansiaceae bacterium]
MMRALWLISAFSLPAFAGDIITLRNGDFFTGKISSLSDGVIQLESPHSEKPLSILSEDLQELTFEPAPKSDSPDHRHLVHLRNGDSIPGDVSALDDQAITLNTWFAGDLMIPRNLIQSVFFEAAPQRLIFSGPDALTNWEQDDGWSTSDDSFRSSGRGSLSRDFNLPEDYIVSFDLVWKNTPSFRFHFSTEASTGSDNKDGYSIYLTSQGFVLSRLVQGQENDKTRIHNLGGPNIRADEFKGNRVKVELRVSRSQKIIFLYLNSNYAGQYSDPAAAAPRGGQIIFESRSSSRRQYEVRAIELREWDSVTRRLNREKQVEDGSDTLATDEGDLFTGEIHSRKVVDERPVYQMKIPLCEGPVSIPESRCSVLYFREGVITEPNKSPYELALATGGSLSLSGIKLGDKTMRAKHPWLGELTLDRRILREMKTPAKASKK